MALFHLQITAPEKTVFDGDVSYCRIETLEGSLGLEARHQPLITLLEKGTEIVWQDKNSNEGRARVSEGIAVFAGNTCAIAVETAAD